MTASTATKRSTTPTVAGIQAAVLFLAVLLVGRALQAVPGLSEWQQVHLSAPFLTALVAHVGLAGLAVALLRLDDAATGLTARQPARWLEIGCIGLAVVGTLGGTTFAGSSALGWPPTGLPGALVLTGAYLLCLPLLARFLRRTRRVDVPPHPATAWILILLLGSMLPVGWALASISAMAAQAVYVLVVVGLGEEFFYRGVLAERLDLVVPGWGWALQAPLFGVAHVLLAANPLGVLAWGLWTTASGLCLGWLRRRSGTILAPALVHGVVDLVGLVVVPAFLA